jgi:hypothetical protein
MAERFLVVLDTTNRPEVTDRALQGGLKNIYFVYAQTMEDARNLVATTFRHRPDILDQIKWSMTATPLSRIAPHITEQNPAWSYIPFQKGMRAPGQQAVPPSQLINQNNPDEIIPMSIPPAPITPPTLNDTPKLSEIAPEAQGKAAAVAPANVMEAFTSPTLPNGQPNPMAAFMSPTLADGQPNPMFAMFQAMAQAMAQTAQANAAPVQPQKAPVPTVTRGDPDNDPELAARMAEVRSTAVAQHRNSDPEALNEELTHAEIKASQEVEKFKMLDKSEQHARTLTQVDNDVDPALMAQMKTVMGRMGATKPADDSAKGRSG